MTDFLLELRSEEIPARMQAKACEDLRWAFETEARLRNVYQGDVVTYVTPRRLVLIARGLAEATELEIEEFKGPRIGAPSQAIDGFLRKLGADRSEMFERNDDKGIATYFVQQQKPSRSTGEVLSEIIPAIIRQFPWPKSMRWGEASLSTESLRWVRPLHGIVALFGEEVVECEIAGVHSGATTLGHRFHQPGEITIGSAADYVEKLRACHVIVDQDERAGIIRDRATALAAEAGLTLIEDEALVAENAGLTEWPAPLLGRFDAAFLDVPPEVIQLTARVNQKYFVCQDAAGVLANAFICVANTDASDGGAAIVEGNRKVLAARLADARFFYETDLKTPLEEQARKLDKIVFHEKLGTVADKVDRVAKLARWLVEERIVTSNPPRHGGVASQGDDGGGSPSGAASAENPLPHASGAVPLPTSGEDLAALAERAARLAKADLVTGMVGEFPELQGVMGGYYARAQGEPREVWEAIRDHYKPVGQGDEVPTAPVTVAVSLADKLDTLLAFFGWSIYPSGSRDPFALRRAALGVISILIANAFSLPIRKVAQFAGFPFVINRAHMDDSFVQMLARKYFTEDQIDDENFEIFWDRSEDGRWGAAKSYTKVIAAELLDFFADRLKIQQREAGVRHDLIDAVFALGGEDDLVRLLARVRALQAFVGTEDGANLLAGYKRAANILKKEGYAPATTLRHPGLDPGSRLFSEEGEEAGPRLGGRGDNESAKSLSYTPEPAEADLIAALDTAEPSAADAVAQEDFEAAMAALATLRGPIDAFFDNVTVNDPDPAKREARLALLARVRDAVHRVADFSRIEG